MRSRFKHTLPSLSLSPLSLCPVWYFTKSKVFGIQKMFPLPEGDHLLCYNYLLTHSAVSLETLLYRIEPSQIVDNSEQAALQSLCQERHYTWPTTHTKKHNVYGLISSLR